MIAAPNLSTDKCKQQICSANKSKAENNWDSDQTERGNRTKNSNNGNSLNVLHVMLFIKAKLLKGGGKTNLKGAEGQGLLWNRYDFQKGKENAVRTRKI